MRIEDLMIGDWIVYKSDSEENAFPVRVTLGMMSNELRKWSDRFEPARLTPEILDKNGFELYRQDFTSNKVYRLGSACYIECCGNGDGYRFDIGPCIEYRHFNSTHRYIHPTMRVWNVHELQHALKICGIEKDIEPL